MSTARRIGLIAGPVLFVAILVAPAPRGLSPEGWGTTALAALMATWWLTEAVPIAATALLPIVLLPLLDAGAVAEAAAPFANPIIFLFFGGFLIALAMERWELHRRIALHVLARAGSRPGSLIGGFMVATAFLSMWVSNSAVALLMLPIGLSVVRFLHGPGDAGEGEAAAPGDAGAGEGRPPGAADAARPIGCSPEAERGARSPTTAPPAPGFGLALMLGIAYAANIGGMGTLVGTPPNAFLAGFLAESHAIDVGFAQWLGVGLPLVAVSLPLAYLILTRVAFRLPGVELPGAEALIERRLGALGPMSRAERRVAILFVTAAVLWIARPLLNRWLPGLSDAGIAVGCGLLLFFLPAGEEGEPLLDWEGARRMPWDVLILFGGGLSLAGAIDRTGVNAWLGGAAAGFADWPPALFVLLATTVMLLLTELTSNTATAAAFLPILGAAALEIGWDPRLLTVPAALAASCAFMLPIATPPNAIVYGSGQVTIPQMARAGLWLNLTMALVVTGLALVLVPRVFGIGFP